MNTSDIKLELLNKLETLKGTRLEEAYGVLLNYINGNIDIDEWKDLSKEQKDALKLGINQLKEGKGISHKSVISEMKERFSND